MAFEYEVSKIQEMCDDIEEVVDSVVDALSSADLPEELWEELQSVDDKLDTIRSEIDDVDGYSEPDVDSITSSLEDIISTARNLRDDL